MRLDRRRDDLLVADGLVGPALAGAITAAVGAATFEEQEIGSRLHRQRERAVIESPAIATGLWAILAPHLADLGRWLGDTASDWHRPVEQWTATGCNPRSRIYRYRPGANFAVHRDIPWVPTPELRSVLTVLVYLPGPGCVGGETRIGEDELIELVDWRIAVFDHAAYHEGLPVERGVKQVLRNDVLATWHGDA